MGAQPGRSHTNKPGREVPEQRFGQAVDQPERGQRAAGTGLKSNRRHS